MNSNRVREACEKQCSLRQTTEIVRVDFGVRERKTGWSGPPRSTVLNAQELEGLKTFAGNDCMACHNGTLLGADGSEAGLVSAWANQKDQGRFRLLERWQLNRELDSAFPQQNSRLEPRWMVSCRPLPGRPGLGGLSDAL